MSTITTTMTVPSYGSPRTGQQQMLQTTLLAQEDKMKLETRLNRVKSEWGKTEEKQTPKGIFPAAYPLQELFLQYAELGRELTELGCTKLDDPKLQCLDKDLIHSSITPLCDHKLQVIFFLERYCTLALRSSTMELGTVHRVRAGIEVFRTAYDPQTKLCPEHRLGELMDGMADVLDVIDRRYKDSWA